MKLIEDNLKHHCGVIGIYSREEENIPEKLFYSLFSLQHRGQESAGIAYRRDDKTVVYKDLGMVSSVLTRYLKKERLSHLGIGHVRYSTHGGNRIENAQPIQVSCSKGDISLAHNGNLSNNEILKTAMVKEGSIFHSTSDTELILHLIAKSKEKNFINALANTLLKIKGAYSMTMIHNKSLIAIRDPQGFRPLFIGKKDHTTVIASETCALDILKITDYRSVKPGELIIIDKNGTRSIMFSKEEKKSQCIFELIYFARPDSNVFDIPVHILRKRLGAALADQDSSPGDIVVPVPDSGNIAALGYSERSGIPFEMGLARNHHAGRSFIMPTTSQREFAVRMKLHPIRAAITGKRVVLIDDSLVRGTTSRTIVKLLKEAGALEVHLRLSSPEIKWPCYFGIDIPTKEELISNRKTPKEIADHIGADSVKFLSIENLKKCVEVDEDFCFACFNGKYSVAVE